MSADLWRIAKPFVRRIQGDQATMIVDDSISEKPYTDENAILLALRPRAPTHRQRYQLSHGTLSQPGGFPTCGICPGCQNGTPHR